MAFKIAEGIIEVRADGSRTASDVAAIEGQASGSADKVGSGIGKKIVAGIGAAIVGGKISETIAENMSIEAGNSVLAAQLGLTKTQSAEAGKIAGELYANNYGESMSNVNDGVAAVISSIDGMDTANAEAVSSMTGKLLNLESTMGIEVGRSAQVAGQLIRSGLAEDGGQAADFLTAALQKVPAELRGDLLDAIDEYGPSFQQLGIGGEQAFGMLVDASSKGMYGIDKTGDALKEFTIRSTDMSASTVAAYEAIGLNADDMAKKVLAGGDSASEATYMTAQGLLEIEDPAARANAAIALFGTPIEDLSTKDIPKFLESLTGASTSMEDAGGAADRMGATLADNAAARVETFKRGIDQWGQSLVQIPGPLGDIAAGASAMGPEMLTAGAAVVTATSGVAGFIPKLAAGTAALATNTGAMIKNGVAAAASGAKAVALGAAQLVMKAPMLAAAAVTGVVTAAQWAWNAAMTANPIGIIIVAIGLLIAAIVAIAMNWDAIVKWVTTVWQGFIDWITPGLEAFAAWWSGFWTGIGDWIAGVWNGFVSLVVAIFQAYVSVIVGIGQGIYSWWIGLWSGIFSWAQGVWSGFVSWVSQVFTNFRTGIATIGNGLLSWWNGLWSGFGRFVKTAVDGVVSSWNNFTSFLGGIPGTIGDIFNKVGSFITSPFKAAFNAVARYWNTTVGSLSFTFPDWIPGLGGNTISGPKLPMLAKGGVISGQGAVMVGEAGPEILNLPRGASVVPLDRATPAASAPASGGGDLHVTVNEARDPLGTAGRIGREWKMWRTA
jgi:phage-related minor tail protein